MKKFALTLFALGLFVILGVACSAEDSSATADNVEATATAVPPTATPVPTDTPTPLPPTETPTPLPPTETPTPTPISPTPTPAPIVEEGIHKQVLKLEDGQELEYAISIPAGYDGENSVPLIVSLSSGTEEEGGQSINPMLDIDFVEKSLRDLGAIIITPFPVNPGKSVHPTYANPVSEMAVLAVMEHVIEHYNIDPEKTLLTGRQWGAKGTWYIAARNQDRFKAAIMNFGFPADDMETYEWTIPVYVIHTAFAESVDEFEGQWSDNQALGEGVDELVEQLIAMEYDIEMVVYDSYPVEPLAHRAGLKDAFPWLLEIWEGDVNQTDSG